MPDTPSSTSPSTPSTPPALPEAEPLILLAGLVKRFATEAGDFEALRGVDLRVMPGEFVAVVGKSGSGKSTLLNMVAGIDRPSAGLVRVAGTELGELSEARLARWRGQSLGIVFQFFQLMPTLTALENVQLPMDFAGRLGAAAQERAESLLAQVGLEAQLHKLPSALSGGEQQRVAIARALANDPPLLVADEPTGNLDSQTADQVFRLFEQLVAAGKTIVFVTHDRDLAARASRVLEIADGRIVGDHAPEEAA